MTLPFDLSEWNLQTAHLIMMENNCANLYRNLSKIAGVMVCTRIWPSSLTLTLDLPEQMFQMAHLHMMENDCVKLFWNPSTIVEVMVWTERERDTHTHTERERERSTLIHQTAVATTMSRSPQADSTKTDNTKSYYSILYKWDSKIP